MKRCPTCNRTYTDETLSFCLDDGTPLVAADKGGQTADKGDQQYDPQATLFMQNPPDFPTSQVQRRTTAGDTPTQPPSNQPQSVQGHQQAPTIQSSSLGTSLQPPSSQSPFQTPPSESPFQQPPSWQPTKPATPYAEKQKKKRSILPWVIGGIVLLVGGGLGLVIVLAVIASLNNNENTNNANNSNVVVNRNANNSNSSKNVNNSNNSNESANKGDNTNNNNSTDSTLTSSLVKYVSDVQLSANDPKGSSSTVFAPKDIIFLNFKVSSLPSNTKVKGIVTIVSMDEQMANVKPGDKIEVISSFNKGKPYDWHFRYIPSSSGWPKGEYKAELYEVADDDTLSLISTVDFMVE